MWDSVASDLFSAASAFQSVVWGLTVGSWIGSSAGLMVAAASPYVAWMSVTAGQAELTAAQVRVAAAAYETAYGLTVPPPVIAENRAELMILIATNLLGQNTPAIAVNEAEYGEMWAQDAAAMFGYAATAATATEALLPFEDAPLITNPGGLLEQAVAVEEAIDTAAANQLMNNVPQALQHGLRGVTAGDQFGPYVLRSGVGADAGCGRGLGRGGRGVGVGCDRLCVGDSRADRCAVGGCGVVVDGGGGHAVCGLAEPSRGAGRAGGDAGRGGRGGL